MLIENAFSAVRTLKKLVFVLSSCSSHIMICNGCYTTLVPPNLCPTPRPFIETNTK